mgnify:CR=1 FL=1
MKNFFIIALLVFTFSKTKANLAYITNEKDNTVSVIDINKKKLRFAKKTLSCDILLNL